MSSPSLSHRLNWAPFFFLFLLFQSSINRKKREGALTNPIKEREGCPQRDMLGPALIRGKEAPQENHNKPVKEGLREETILDGTKNGVKAEYAHQ